MSVRTAIAILLCIAGCGRPNAANIELRKQNQVLRDAVDTLNMQRDADLARIRAQEEKAGTLPTLSSDRLATLYTTHGLKLGRLTGGADLDPAKGGDEGLKVYLNPVDEEGDAVKAVGTFHVEAWELSDNGRKIGTWDFSPQDMRKNWYGAPLRSFVFTLPWQQEPPRESDLTLKMRFSDELSGRIFEEQKVVKVALPGSGSSSPPPSTSVTQTTPQP